MRTPLSALIEQISTLLRQEPVNARALALGGSRGVRNEDVVSDCDLVVLFEEGPLLEHAARIKLVLDPLLLTEDALRGGPSWKEGFGCRISYLYRDGFKVEIFANTPSTIPNLPRPLRWTPLFGDVFLSEQQQRLAAQLAQGAVMHRALFDYTYATMSVCRHLVRGELFAAEHVLTTLTASALALVQYREGGDYDPYASYKRVYRDDVIALPLIRQLRGLSSGAGSAEGLLDRLIGMHRIMNLCFAEWARRDVDAMAQWRRAEAIVSAALAWLKSAT